MLSATVKIAYPDKWRDYAPVVIRRDDLLGDAIRTRDYAYQYVVDQLGNEKEAKCCSKHGDPHSLARQDLAGERPLERRIDL